MKREDVIFGMRVVPSKKIIREYSKIGDELKKQPFYYVGKPYGYGEGEYKLHHDPTKKNYWPLLPEDFEPYQPKEESFYVVGWIDDGDGEFTLSQSYWQHPMTLQQAMNFISNRFTEGKRYDYYVMKAVRKVEYIEPKPAPPPVVITELE